MTLRGLLQHLSHLTDEQLEAPIAVYDEQTDEYFTSEELKFSEADDVLPDGWPFLTFNSVGDES